MPERAKRLHRASVELLGELDLRRLQEAIVQALRDILKADAAAVMLKDRESGALVIGAQEGMEGLGDHHLIESEGQAKVLAIPLTRDGEFIGSLNAYMKDPQSQFNEESVDLAHVLAFEASVAIRNAQLYQESLRQSDLQRSIFEAAGEGIIITYPPGAIGPINAVAAGLLGVDPATAGLSVDEARARFGPRDAGTGKPIAPTDTATVRALRGEAVHQEVVYRNVRTGADRIADVKARPVWSGGKIVAAVTTMYDLTEMRRVEQEREQFLSIVSHELRTPLTPLKALAQLLIARIRRSRERDQPLDTASLERNLASIERQVDRMNGLVTDLLSVSRAGRGTLEMDRVPFDLATSVRDIVERYIEATREEGRHRFVVEAPATLVVSADQSRIEQMLMNLIGNAVKYSPRGGEVRVQLRQQDGHAEVVITDQGIGIAPQDLGRLGDPFTRGTGKAASFAGLGIGLHVAKLMAEAHGGSLRLESEGEDRGTRVRVDLLV